MSANGPLVSVVIPSFKQTELLRAAVESLFTQVLPFDEYEAVVVDSSPDDANRRMVEELAAKARGPGNVYFTGGATALLLGLREQTIDVDIKLDPEPAGVFEAIADLKKAGIPI